MSVFMQFWAENLTAVLFLFYSSGTFDIKVSSWMLYRLEAAEKKKQNNIFRQTYSAAVLESN